MLTHKITFVDDEPAVVTVVHDGEIYTALAGQHAAFDQIVDMLSDDIRFLYCDTEIVDLFSVEAVVRREFQALGDGRVTVENGEVNYDGDPLNESLTKQVLRLLDEGETKRLSSFVKFVENVMANPKANSREQLFAWLSNGDYTITDNGHFVAYKGVYLGSGNLSDVGFSTRRAPTSEGVRVNGVLIENDVVPNPDGAVVTMPRHIVDPIDDIHCSVGLHVGTWDYAQRFTGNVLEVHVNPKDVVAVTSDENRAKIRCCRYEVVSLVNAKHTAPVVDSIPEDVPAKVEAVDDSVLRPGDRVKTVAEVRSFPKGDYFGQGFSIPIGSLATVTGITSYGGVDVRWDNPAYGDNTWQRDRFEKVTEAKVSDTRQNHLAQNRYPKGHPRAGQFVPKGATV